MKNRSLVAVIKRTSNEAAKTTAQRPSATKRLNCPYCGYQSWPSLEFALERHLAREHNEGPSSSYWFTCHTFVMGPYLCQPCSFQSYFKLSILEHRRWGEHVWVPGGGKRWQNSFHLDCCDKHKLAQRESTVQIRSLLVYLRALHSCGGKAKDGRTRKRKTGPYASLMETLQQRIGEQCQELAAAPGPQSRVLYQCKLCLMTTRSWVSLKEHSVTCQRPQTASDLYSTSVWPPPTCYPPNLSSYRLPTRPSRKAASGREVEEKQQGVVGNKERISCLIVSRRQNGVVRSEVHHCPSCSFKTDSRTNLANHVLVHHETPPTVSVTWFKCHKCCFKSKHRNLYRRHYFIMHE